MPVVAEVVEAQEAPDAWKDEAACAGMSDLFFVLGGESKGYEAKRICATCTVQDRCLDYAISLGVNLGVWGGMNRNELIKERRARARSGRGV